MADVLFTLACQQECPDEVQAEVCYRLEKLSGVFVVYGFNPSKRLKDPIIFHIEHAGKTYRVNVYKIE